MANKVRVLVEYEDEDNPNIGFESDNKWRGLDYLSSIEIQEQAKSILDTMLAKGRKAADG